MALNRQTSKDAVAATAPGSGLGPAPSSAADDKWDEERYEASLRHLHDLHIKLRRLRATIHKMVQPITEPQSSNPEASFAALRESVTASQQDVKNFRDAWTDEKTTKILERARTRRQQLPLGIKPWRPRDDPNWTKMEVG